MRSDFVKAKALEELTQAMPIRAALAVRVCLETGMRVGDCVALRWDNIKCNTVSYIAQKTGKKDTKKLSKRLVADLKLYGGNEYIFESVKAKSGHMARQTVYKALKKAARMAGHTENITPHSARKAYAVEMRDRVGLAETQRLLQHTSADVTALYAMSDVALGGRVSSAELTRLVEMISTRTAQKVISALFAHRHKKNTP